MLGMFESPPGATCYQAYANWWGRMLTKTKHTLSVAANISMYLEWGNVEWLTGQGEAMFVKLFNHFCG